MPALYDPNKTYGVGGIKLPNIRGLSLRRKQKTKFGLRDLVVDQSGKVYGMANPAAQLRIGMAGPANARFLSLIRRGGAANAGVTPGAPPSVAYPGFGIGPSGNVASGRTSPAGGSTASQPGAATNTNPLTNPDDFSGYGDYPMVATYLRGLQKQAENFGTAWKDNILPQVSSGLQNISNIGANIASQYGGAVGTGAAPGYVTNAYNAGAAVGPAQVASGLGGASQTFNPNALAAGQASSAAAGQSAAANAKYNTLISAAAPVAASQGILANLTKQAATISQQYAEKRMTERLRLDQWIQEQKIAQENLKIKNDYNLALMKASGMKIDETKRHNLVTEQTGQANAETARINANNAGSKTDEQMATAGFIRVPKTKMGPKSQAIVNKTVVTSKSGTQWYNPHPGSSGSGSSGGPSATPEQKQKVIGDLKNMYLGNATDNMGNVIGTTDKGYRTKTSINDQASQVTAFLVPAIKNGLVGKTQVDVASVINASIGNAERWDGTQFVVIPGGKQKIIRLVIGALVRAGLIK